MLVKGIDYKRISGSDYNPYGRQYQTLRDYHFFFRTKRVTIPAGYQWDGPTGVPYVGTLNSGWLEPSLRHDFMYEEQGRIPGITYTQKEADEFLFEGLLLNNVSPIYIWVMRLFLFRVFKKAWDNPEVGASKVLRRYMVPFVLFFFAIFAGLTSGAVLAIPALWDFLTKIL